MRPDAHVIEYLTIARDKIVGQRIYDENKHKPVRRFGPLDYSAKNIPAPKIKPLTKRQGQKFVSSENTNLMIAWLEEHGPGTSDQVAVGTGLLKRTVATSLAAAHKAKRVSAFVPKGMRRACSVWAVVAW
jgi:hypothetical protein